VGAWPNGQPGAHTPAVIAAAVARGRGGQLPGTAVPPSPAPDVTAADQHLTGEARGEIGGVAVTMFAYATPAGARVTIIRASRPFPEAGSARELAWGRRARPPDPCGGR
jgi:hypothetical protein